jgi:tetratricopeptide (TPR) repeat protein
MKNVIITFILTGCIATYAAADNRAVNTNNDSRSSGEGNSYAWTTSPDDQGGQKEDDAYSSAQDALNQGDYAQAAESFDSVAKMNGSKADAALYWKAYALNKQARRNEALSTIKELRNRFPRSNYLKTAAALEVDINRANGNPTTPTAEGDDEMKMIALQALMDQNEDRALPILEKILTGNSSQRVKDKAMFVLSQNESPKAQQLLGDIATGKQYPGLQEKAIHYLAIEGGRAGEQLVRIYDSTSDVKIKKTVLHAFIVSGDQERAFAIAQKETSPELKTEAIHTLGVMGDTKDLRQLYKQASSPELKKELIHSLGVGGDTDGLIEISKNETDPAVKSEIIHSLGVFGGRRASDALLDMYNAAGADKNTKNAVIDALFVQGSAKQLVAMARKETDPEMKKRIVSKLAIMGSKEGNDYLLEILNQ